MSETVEDSYMTMKMSHSGFGCNMVTPNGKKNVYCNLQRLVEFVEGLNDSVSFKITIRDESAQSTLNTGVEDGK